ncbi:type II toxin-antitoxin system RelE/ParE family toxin [Pseudobutyrivibrio sp.]|uniref:type II toxin-antitoxin system RelE/ParE family toxin n=1 Tax=Pseudobutyrivibrio sp. TaxID=2014367 RepID=UPI0025F9A37D|nr:type II toxin-antitoxin system RelE/ParE family toxin [Pseudobutyrivibrio sp.]
MKIQYSPEAVDRLKDIKRIWGINTYKNIRESISGLSTVPQKGALVENYIEIPNPYRFLHVSQHYVFYRIDENTSVVKITDIFSEREDFLHTMFGVSLQSMRII